MIAGRGGAATACGDCELGRARRHLERAAAELRQAHVAWGCWADSVRQLTEEHYRVADFDDRRVLTDPGYGQALDIGGPAGEAVRLAWPGRRCGLPAAGRIARVRRLRRE